MGLSSFVHKIAAVLDKFEYNVVKDLITVHLSVNTNDALTPVSKTLVSYENNKNFIFHPCIIEKNITIHGTSNINFKIQCILR